MTHPEVALFEDIGCEPNATILSNLAYPLSISIELRIYIQKPWFAFANPRKFSGLNSLVELIGIEPMTSRMQIWRSPS